MALRLDGKIIAQQLSKSLQNKVKELKTKNIFPTLCVIEVGEDPASTIYLRAKRNLAKKIGINEITIKFPSSVTEAELLQKIAELNRDPKINAIMVQLPLPQQINPLTIVKAIDPAKDADGFHPYNQGLAWQGASDILPATVRGILEILDYYKINVTGKNVLVIGRSLIVGKPIASQLLNRDATVTIAHSKTVNLQQLTQQADLIISDVGKAHLITSEMIKKGAILVDVGMNREQGKLMGDIEYEECFAKAKAITPVPGGVGPLTVASLMKQVIILTEYQVDGR